MSLSPKTPMALYKANLELVLRIGTLLQENRQRWMQTGMEGTSNAIQQTLAETERMLTTNDWSSLSQMPGANFWNSMSLGTRPLAAPLQSAVENQTAFAAGLQNAFEAWQQQSADALGIDSMEFPVPAFAESMKAAATSAFNEASRTASTSGTKAKPSAQTDKPKPKSQAKPKQKPNPKPKPKAASSSKAKATAKSSTAKRSAK